MLPFSGVSIFVALEEEVFRQRAVTAAGAEVFNLILGCCPEHTTDTGSSPIMKRAISKSWIVISRNIPPETRTYSANGGDGSREIITKDSGLPMLPCTASFFTLRNCGSKRWLKPIKSETLCSFTTFKQSRTRTRSRGTGFSQKIALPCFAASKKPRKQHTPEFRNKALKLAERIGVAAAARELSLYESQLYNWRSKQQSQATSSERESEQAAEITHLKRQLAERDEKLAILQKAATYFTKRLK
ncbi:transposase IS3 family [Serratia symbiotica]|uniref:Transposase IS3 family n=1 Tax=Serratia symbiotica TaxID=138074 RepID=A0A455VLJ5_9GAMM|nr:transposase IS3 family [Serratia symbiotica]